MKRIQLFIAALAATVTLMAQTLNVQVGQVTYQFPAAQAGEMVYADGTTLTILNKVFTLSEVTRMYVDTTTVTDNSVSVVYQDTCALVRVAGNVAQYVDVAVDGAHVDIAQLDALATEVTYTLSGSSSDGAFLMSGSYKATVALNGLTLTNPNGAPVNIQNGKRIEVSIKSGTVNTLTDGTGNTQKGCFVSKGHTEFKGKGTLNVYGLAANGIWSKEYVTVKNCTINVLSAVKDGLNCNQYFAMESGELTIKSVGDDALQISFEDDGTDAEDTGAFTLTGGTLDVTATADAAKGIKAAGNVYVQGGSLTVTQTGNIVTDSTGISYPTSVKSDSNIVITGGTVTVNNAAAGGKGLSAEGHVTINENDTTTIVNITANGTGGTAENAGGSSTTTGSYKIYVSVPTSGGGMGPGGSGNRAWSSIYLYKSDGTLVEQLTKSVSKSSGYTTTTFYYYDFKASDNGTYYFQAPDYTSRGTTYTIRSVTFSGPTTGEDIYYSINNSYSTSGSVRTYRLTNVTNTYGGSSDTGEESGTAYNAIGIKADVAMAISGGTVTVANSGSMSKSLKADTVTVSGGIVTLKPSGSMLVVSGDASYSSGIKTKEFVQTGGQIEITATGTANRGVTANNITVDDGTLTVTNSSGGYKGSSDSYTAKGLKADAKVALNGGVITISMTGAGGKGIKANDTFTQGTADGNGPTLTVSTTGSRFGSSSGGGMWGGSSSGGSAKAIKVMGAATLYGGETTVTTATDGAEGLESKTQVNINGGRHYFKCYDDCINATKGSNNVSGKMFFNGGVTVCWSTGNDAVDSNAGTSGAITIGDGAVLAYTSKGGAEEGFDCDNNSYIQITGKGIGISAGGSQGGGGMGGSSSGNTISNAAQGYYFSTSSLNYTSGKYYTLADASGNNLVTYSFPTDVASRLALLTATGMVKGSSYNVKYSTAEPTDATTAFHGLYLGSSAKGEDHNDFKLDFTAQ